MAGPELEKGHTRVAHEIFEEIGQYGLNGTQYGIVLQIWRYTYGFGRKKARLSLSFLAQALRKTKSHIDRELNALITRNVIHVSFDPDDPGRYLEFNKYFNTWHARPPRAPRIKSVSDPPPAPQPKKRSKKKSEYAPDDRVYLMALYFHNKIMEHAAINKVDHLVRDADMQKWADEFRKIVEIDKRDRQELKSIINWCTEHSFWSTNILSPKKLREKYAELGIKMAAESGTGSKPQSRTERNKELLQKKMREGKQVEPGGDDQTLIDLFGGVPDGGSE